MAIVVPAIATSQPHALPEPFSTAGSMRFTENRGQIFSTKGEPRPDILYTAASHGVKVFFRASGISYVFAQVTTPSPRRTNAPDELPLRSDLSTSITTYRMDMELVDANPNPVVAPEEQTAEQINYYSPRYPAGIAGIRSFGRLVYRDVYPNIDMVFYREGDGMKYDFVVHPGGDVSDIKLRYVGADKIKATGEGTVVASNPLGTVEEGKIYSYQTVSYTSPQPSNGSQSGIRSSYVLTNGIISFDVPHYDPTRPLVIDPPVMWSTYCGGRGNDITLSWNHGSNTIDSDRNVIITGSCVSTDFPVTTGAFQTRRMGLDFTYDTYVAKFSPNGSQLWATYYGGSLSDHSYGVVTDGARHVIFAGATSSFDFPITQGAYRLGRTSANDGFIVKLDSNGKRIWASYYPNGQCFALTTDRSNNIVVGGMAWSKMPTTVDAFQKNITGVGPDGFIAKFSGSGSLVWSTYYGGSGASENIGSLATDSRSNVLVSGYTSSADFPVSENAFQPNIGGAFDAFLLKLDSSGNRSWGTYFGGLGADYGYGVAADPNDNVVMTGYSTSTDLPTTGGTFQPKSGGGTDAYIAKFSPGGKRVWGSYFGGNSTDISYNIAIDGRSNIWVAGYTYSRNLPISYDAYQSELLGDFSADAMVAQFDLYGNRIWATYLGGSSNDYATGIAASLLGVVVTGTTLSENLPVTEGAFQSSNAGSYDAFITQFCNVTATTIAVRGPRRFCQGESTVLSAPPGFQSYLWSNGQTGREIVVKEPGRYYVTLGVGGCDGTTDPVEITVDPLPRRVIGVIGSTRLCGNDSTVLTVGDGLLAHRWSTGDTTASIVVREPGRYSVAFIDSNGCAGRTDTLEVTRHPSPNPVIATEGETTFCEGGSVVLDAGPGYARYLWPGGEQTQRVTVGKSGAYTVRVMNEAGCWAESAPIMVTVLAKPMFKVAPLLPTVFCHGDSTVLSCSGEFTSYKWSTGETTRTIVVRDAGKYTLTAFNEDGCSASASVTVQIAPNPSPTIATNRPTRICVGETITLDAGEGYRSYRWSTGEMTQRIVVSEPGLYNVEVTNSLGCPGTSNTVQVEVVPKPTASFTGARSVCLNSVATYSAPMQEGVSYEWSVTGAKTVNGLGTNRITVTWGGATIGTVRLTARFASSDCVADTLITVVVGSTLMPSISASGPLAICPGGNVVLDAGEGYEKYLWSNGANTPTITVEEPGRYSVTVTEAGGCSGTSEPVTVTDAAPPAPKITPLGSTTFCAGRSVTLDAGAGYKEYLWSNGFTTRHITVDDANEYFVTVTNSGGCSATSPAIRTEIASPPALAIAGAREVCRGSQALYGAPQVMGYRYKWSVEGGTIVSGRGSSLISVQWDNDGSGRLNLELQSEDSACIGFAPTFTVKISDTLQPSIAAAGPTSLCTGQTVVLDAGPGYESYLWSNGAKSQTIVVDRAGSYGVTVTGVGGCLGRSAPVVVEMKQLPQPAISALGATEFCEGEKVTLSATEGFSNYLWSNGATTPSITVSDGGIYMVTASDADGCSTISAEVAVTVHPLPEKPVITKQGEWLLAPAASGYVWMRNGQIVQGGTSQSILASENGSYTVTIRNAGGCEATSEPFYKSAAGVEPHTVWLDTASEHVGTRFRLTMAITPVISPADGIRGYRASLRINPRSLFVHQIISPDRTTAGDAATLKYEGNGLYVIERPATSQPLESSHLFEIEMEGLSTGVPVNDIIIESVEIAGLDRPRIAAHGVVLLSGCDISQGVDFNKRVRLQSIRPNPVSQGAAIIYRAPAGSEPVLRMINTIGQEVFITTLPAGTNEDQQAHVGLNDLPSGVYTLELRDGNEISTLPLVIRK